MVDRAIWKAVEEIVQGEGALSLAAAGGGSALLNWLFDHPGASRVMLEAQIPYAESALEEYLRCPGPHRVTQELREIWPSRPIKGRSAMGIAPYCTAAWDLLPPWLLDENAEEPIAHTWLCGRTNAAFFTCSPWIKGPRTEWSRS